MSALGRLERANKVCVTSLEMFGSGSQTKPNMMEKRLSHLSFHPTGLHDVALMNVMTQAVHMWLTEVDGGAGKDILVTLQERRFEA